VGATENESLPENVIAALTSGRKIEAIKLLHEDRGLGLKDANDIIEQYIDSDLKLKNILHNGKRGNSIGFILITLMIAAYFFMK